MIWDTSIIKGITPIPKKDNNPNKAIKGATKGIEYKENNGCLISFSNPIIFNQQLFFYRLTVSDV